jgi:putative FmdB family regulatory protein
MPTYDYKCGECGHVFEEFQSIKADPLKDCPACRKPALKRLMAGGAGMIFKGSGFYLTDYKKSSSTGSSKESPPKKTEKKDPPKPPAASATTPTKE